MNNKKNYKKKTRRTVTALCLEYGAILSTYYNLILNNEDNLSSFRMMISKLLADGTLCVEKGSPRILYLNRRNKEMFEDIDENYSEELVSIYNSLIFRLFSRRYKDTDEANRKRYISIVVSGMFMFGVSNLYSITGEKPALNHWRDFKENTYYSVIQIKGPRESIENPSSITGVITTKDATYCVYDVIHKQNINDKNERKMCIILDDIRPEFGFAEVEGAVILVKKDIEKVFAELLALTDSLAASWERRLPNELLGVYKRLYLLPCTTQGQRDMELFLEPDIESRICSALIPPDLIEGSRKNLVKWDGYDVKKKTGYVLGFFTPLHVLTKMFKYAEVFPEEKFVVYIFPYQEVYYKSAPSNVSFILMEREVLDDVIISVNKK